MNDCKIIINNEQDGLAETIRKITKEELKVHKKNASEIMKSNFKTTNEHLAKIPTEVLELKKSLEFTQNQLDG